jgi:hypothetical protein
MPLAEILVLKIDQTLVSSEARLGCENTEFCFRSQYGSSVTNRAIRLRVNVVLGSKLLAEFQLLLYTTSSPSQIRDLVYRTQVWLRIAVTIQTPRHRLILGLIHYFHLIDSPVARNTGNTTVHVSRMIEIHIVGQTMDPHPIDRIASSPTLTQRLELRRLRMNR